MEEPADHTTTAKPQKRPRGRMGLWVVLSLAFLAAAGGIGVLVVTGRSVPVPDWLLTRLVERVNLSQVQSGAAPTLPGRITVGAAEVQLAAGGQPVVRLRNLGLYTVDGQPLAQLPQVSARLEIGALLRGGLQPVVVQISGAQVTLRRSATGGLGLDLSAGGTGLPPPATEPLPTDPMQALSELLAEVQRAFEHPLLSQIERVEAIDLAVVIRDARVGRTWRASRGMIALTQSAQDITLSADVSLPGMGGAPSSAALTFALHKGTRAADFSATIVNAPARDIATQAPAMAWLSVVEAPISGTFRAALDASGQVGTVDGTLAVGAGVLRPVNAVQPVAFKGGSGAFSYDPGAGRISVTDLAFDADELTLRGEGRAYLADVEGGLPRTLLGQMRLRDLRLDPAGVFATPVAFREGAVDLKLTLNPFGLRIGQLVLIEAAPEADGGRRIEAKGRIGASDAGWDVALDLALDSIEQQRLLALWPAALAPQTREWFVTNLAAGRLSNVRGALRMRPGSEPVMSLGFEFSGVQARVIRTLPPLTDAAGHATITGNSLVMVVAQGQVTPPQGGAVNIAGTVFRVPDITAKPAAAVIDFRSDSTMTAALSLLDAPAYRFLTKAGQKVDVVAGRARVAARVALPLAKRILPGELTYTVNGELSGIASTTLVPGRSLVADSLTLSATEEGMQVTGPGTLDGLPFTATWDQPFGPEGAGRCTIIAQVELSPAAVETLGLGLPEGAVGGKGTGQLVLDIIKGSPTAFRLTSTLEGVSLRLPEIGWQKPADAAAMLEIAGSLGTPPLVDRIELDAPGMRVSGSLTVSPEGGLGEARLTRVRAGNWLDAPVLLTGRGQGAAPAIAVTGGTLDMRQTSFGGGSGGTAGGPISVRLNRLILSEGIALTGFSGEFGTNGGFNGRFQAALNEAVPITGAVGPSENGAAVRLQADDAGAVFRAAGIFGTARGGALDLTLIPRTAAGEFDGRLRVENTRVRDAPVLASLLGAISVVGLLEQLGGEGLVFNDVQADFRLTPAAVEIIRGSAVGASLGVSMSGIYDLGNKAMQLRGVISPIYLLNGIGSFLTRRGEGLFGFNYDVTGTADAPKVSVNPLSILTPGMFREIFRTPAPKLSQ